MALVFADPTIVDLLQWYGIEIVKFLASAPDRNDEIGRFEQRQMLGYRLARHIVQAFA